MDTCVEQIDVQTKMWQRAGFICFFRGHQMSRAIQPQSSLFGISDKLYAGYRFKSKELARLSRDSHTLRDQGVLGLIV